MRNPRRVAIFLGGMSPEHDISVLSGLEVFKHMSRERWSPFLVRIGRDGTWQFSKSPDFSNESFSITEGLTALLQRTPDVVFPLLHGAYGEDGRFQGLMDYLHLPYVGSECLTSALALNKARARDVLSHAGLRVPEGEELCSPNAVTIEVPCVIKPMHLGSSVGLRIAHTPKARTAALQHAFNHDHRVLVEAFIQGREFTAGVIDSLDGPPIALPIVEIRPKTSAFFDYHAKYTPDATDELCPAPIDNDLRLTLQAIGLRAHHALGCRHMSRTDVIVTPAGIPYVLETNTLPGMTSTSLLPQAAEVHGLGFPELLDHLLHLALGRPAPKS